MSPRLHQSLVTTTAALTTLLTTLLTALVTLAGLAALPADAGPDGGNVVAGSTTILGAGSGSVTVNQSSQNAIINWHTFNIGAGETTRFNQPNTSSIALNRVIGGLGPSQIFGTLTANGRVFIINGDGILFGPNAVVNTAGFLATTNDIRNEDFMAGKYNFNIPGRPNASIVNLGTITATSGGFAALVAPGVRNSGTITATLGTVSLAAGNGFTLDFYGDRLITLAVNDQIAARVIDVATGQPLKALVGNDGRIQANGGRVELTAAAARVVVDAVINNRGVIEASSIGTRNGMIVLGAATGASKPAGAPVQTVKLAGKISAAGKDKGTTGGTVVVTGENIVLAGAAIEASGQTAGGKVLIGGDTGGGKPSPAAAAIELAKPESFTLATATTVSVDAASVINASATGQGNGGKVVIWSDQQTTFAGTILARGGPSGGNGGFIETSGHQILTYNGTVDLSAPKGQVGTALLDPGSVSIDANAGTGIITVASIQTGLQTGNFIVTTGTSSGDITVDSNVNLTWASPNTLTLSAFNNINFRSGATISNSGAGNLVLRADNTGTATGIGNGKVILATGSQINFSGSTGTVSIYYNPECDCSSNKYQHPTDYSSKVSINPSVPNQLTAYMLVDNSADLALIGDNLTGTYALGKNIDATGFTGFSSGTSFNGLLDGNGGLGVNSSISNLTLHLLTKNSKDSYGLLPFIGSSGIVRNLNLANVDITASADTQFIGALAGQSSGMISNVAVLSGTVNGGSFTGIGAGGLVGQNNTGGSIKESSANVTVTVGDATGASQINMAGGLVASNLGAISGSSAFGNVSGGAFSWAGGFFGANYGTIFQTFTTGSVSGGANSFVGGFAGANAGGSLRQVFATGAVTGGDNSVVGGLAGYNGTFANTSGQITDTFATGAASGGANSTVGGLVGQNQNGSSIQTSYSAGAVSGGAGSTLGGLVAQSTGTVTNSYWNTQTSGQQTSAGGTGLTTAQLIHGLPPGFDPAVWTILPDPSFPYFPWQPNITIPNIVLSSTNPPSQTQIIDNLVGTFTLASLPPPVVDILPPPPSGPGPGTGPGTQLVSESRLFAVPPRGETRFVKDEVVLMADCDTPQSARDTIARELNLIILASQCLTQSHKAIIRLHINGGQTVANVIRALARYRIIAVAQANYIYALVQEGAQDSNLAGRTQEGDAAQYALGKLGLIDVHRLLKGTNISIAVIDSKIDVQHPDLEGVIAEQYDAVGAEEMAHPHGTGMAGAIAAHRRLMGIAPSARLYAIHAFSSAAASADSTTYNILRSLDWAASKGVRVINMSFAGPRDPSMERALKNAHDKGIVLIAAAGNAGPKSPPLYPGADPNVIAVTATDINDKLFAGANRGRYIAVAAPGVDILVPAPEGGYQLTTGTSVASAEVSGIAALLLERNPNLTPDDIRKILTVSAKHPGTRERDDDFGSGLVDPSKAVQAAGDLKPVGQPARR